MYPSAEAQPGQFAICCPQEFRLVACEGFIQR
jgi:hypothetical protein